MANSALLTLVAALSGAAECEPPGDRDRNPCRFAGHCFDLHIDGQAVALHGDDGLTDRLEDVTSTPICWSLAEPVTGAMQSLASANAFTAEHLGPLYDELEIVVAPLEGQTLPTRKAIRTDPTVRIGGVPMQTTVDVIDVAALPEGAYVATFRARGPQGWDRKGVYLEVRRPADD